MSAQLEAALGWAARGLPVFPLFEVVDGVCSCRRPDCTGNSRGKHPRVLEGLKSATLDETTIRKWWGRSTWAASNIGIRTGAPGIIALDLDTPAAAAALLELAAGRPIGGLIVGTGRGRQVWLRAPAADDVRNAESWRGIGGFDVRGRGGYVIAPPSRHYSGAEYRILNGTLEPLPGWLYDLLRRRRAEASPSSPRHPACDGEGTWFGTAALRRECAELRATDEGARNRKLNLVSYLAGRLVAGGELDESHAIAEITRAAEDAGLEPFEIVGRDGQSGTLWSGLRSGETRPMRAVDAPDAMPEKGLLQLFNDQEPR